MDTKALLATLETAARDLAVEKRRMFGCDALFSKGSIFALVWKKGRIGVRLPERAAFDELMAERGAGPWKAGPMTMSHWVFVPASFHEDAASLRTWVRRAHALAAPKASSPAKKRSKTTVTKRSQPTKVGAAKKAKKGTTPKRGRATKRAAKKATKSPRRT